MKFLEDCLAEQGYKIERLEGNLHSGGDATIETFWPDRDVQESDDLSDNNRSLVSLIEFAGIRILLCSDIEEYAQREILRLHPDLQADVVVPHHGSAGTRDETFLESLNAEVLICSCDQKQYERTTSDIGQVADLSNQVKTFYTARDGTIETTAFQK